MTDLSDFTQLCPNSSLTETLEGIKRNNTSFEFQIFDKEKIETRMLALPEFQIILQKFFPKSFESQLLSNIGLNVALNRFGMPQPVLYKLPNEDKTLTLKEVLKLYPQGNQYGSANNLY